MIRAGRPVGDFCLGWRCDFANSVQPMVNIAFPHGSYFDKIAGQFFRTPRCCVSKTPALCSALTNLWRTRSRMFGGGMLSRKPVRTRSSVTLRAIGADRLALVAGSGTAIAGFVDQRVTVSAKIAFERAGPVASDEYCPTHDPFGVNARLAMGLWTKGSFSPKRPLMSPLIFWKNASDFQAKIIGS